MAVIPGGCGAVSWELPGAPANGWDEVTLPITVHAAPDAAGWCFGYQVAFMGGSLGYVGIRPRPGGAQLSAFCVAGEGSAVLDARRCRPATDGRPGATCSVWAPLLRHREYLFTVYRDRSGSPVWRGLLADGDTGKQWKLGAWVLPHDGGIEPSQVGVMGYYKAIGSCEQLPMASLHFGAPYNAPTGATGRCHSPANHGRCSGHTNYRHVINPDGTVWMRNGWPTRGQRDRPCTARVTVTVDVAAERMP